MPITLPIPNSPGGNAQATNAQSYYSGSNYGEYSFVSLQEIINNFTAVYVGENKIFANLHGGDISYHAHRALQELHYDTLKSCKSIEVEVCNNLKVPLPNDYVNYVKVSRVDSDGIHRIIYPTRKTSNPFAIEQDQDACTDCGDNNTSQTYQYNGQNLDPQDEICSTQDLTTPSPTFSNWAGCAAQTIYTLYGVSIASADYTVNDIVGILDILTVGNTVLVGAGPCGFAINPNANSTTNGYFQDFFASVDTYCQELAAVGGPINCGAQNPAGWTNWNMNVNNMTLNQIFTETLANGGWTAFTDPLQPANNGINLNALLTGGLPQVTQTVTTYEDISDSWSRYKSSSANSNSVSVNSNASVDNSSYFTNMGQRFGMEPEFSHNNGSYFIDCRTGMIFFSSSMVGETIVLEYISDGHGTDDELIVPKLAEEAMYKWIAYGCAQARADVDQGTIARFKREKFAETRKAKIRLSNIKLEEITQVFRGISKHIKH